MALPMAPWYKDGLRFKCTGCGKCCTGAPGIVALTDDEAKTIADHLNMPLPLFTDHYLRKVNSKLALKETGKQWDCVFLKNKQCSIYPVRPKQCRTFPWWIYNLESPADWQEAGRHCEGINHPDAPLIPLSTIQENLLQDNG